MPDGNIRVTVVEWVTSSTTHTSKDANGYLNGPGSGRLLGSRGAQSNFFNGSDLLSFTVTTCGPALACHLWFRS